MLAAIDILVSPTLRHLRARWWNNAFTEFLAETLKPRPGRRILDVGCGRGTGELAIGRLHISQLRLVGIDRMADKVAVARREVESHNMRASFATGDASRRRSRERSATSGPRGRAGPPRATSNSTCCWRFSPTSTTKN